MILFSRRGGRKKNEMITVTHCGVEYQKETPDELKNFVDFITKTQMECFTNINGVHVYCSNVNGNDIEIVEVDGGKWPFDDLKWVKERVGNKDFILIYYQH